MNKFCTYDGEKLQVGAMFCHFCGRSTASTPRQRVKVQQSSVHSEEKAAPGKGTLKATGILGLIFAGLTCSIVFIELGSIYSYSNVVQTYSGFSWQSYFIFAFIVSAYCIYVSIKAIIHCANSKIAYNLKMLGIRWLFLSVLMGIVDIFTFGVSSAVLIPISLVLPILYIAGASKNIRAFEENDTCERIK